MGTLRIAPLVVSIVTFYTTSLPIAVAQPVPVTTHPIAESPETARLDSAGPRVVLGGPVLANAPNYRWYYGCTPTVAGMLVGYWDGKAGYENLVEGDASTQTQAVYDMIASEAHRTAGAENGYGYGDWHNSPSYPDHENNPDCLADFMHTVNAGTAYFDIAPGLQQYVQWDNPATAVDESYGATAEMFDDPFWSGGELTYEMIKGEINAQRPVLLDVTTYCEYGVPGNWYGHSVMAYGYQDDMFQLFPPGGTQNIIVPGVAVMDTWTSGETTGSEWIIDTDDDGEPDAYFESYIDPDGVEWWPFLSMNVVDGNSYTNYWDWMVSDAVFLDIVPEPACLSLLLAGSIIALARKRP